MAIRWLKYNTTFREGVWPCSAHARPHSSGHHWPVETLLSVLSSAIVLGTLLNVLVPVQDLIYVLCKANENANFCAELLIRDLSYDNGTAKF